MTDASSRFGRVSSATAGQVGGVIRFAALCTVIVALSIARSWQLGVDTNWDLLHYHLYKSTALLDGSLGTDVAVSGLGFYLNPLIELPVGVAIRLLGIRAGLIVGVGVVQIACYASVWRLGVAIGRVTSSGRWLPPTLTVLAVTGSAAVSVAYTTLGDWVVAGLLCEALRLLLLSSVGSVGDDNERGRRVDLIAGALVGASVGLKLTAAPLAIGLLIAAFLVVGVSRLLWILAGVAAGFAVLAGPWMVYMQSRYGSPLFPFYNRFFGAQSAGDYNFDDTRFGASSAHSFIEFPVEMFRGTTKYSEFMFQDWRYIVLLGLGVAVTILKPAAILASREVRVLSVALIISFVLWLVVFGIYRYFLFGEILASMLIVLLILVLVQDGRRTAAVCGLIATVGLGFLAAPDWGRNAQISSPVIAATMRESSDPPQLVALSAGPPMSYLLEDFPDEANAIELWPFSNGYVSYEGEIKKELDDLVEGALSENAFVAVTDAGADKLLPPLDHLVVTDCVPFESAGRALQLCGVEAPAQTG